MTTSTRPPTQDRSSIEELRRVFQSLIDSMRQAVDRAFRSSPKQEGTSRTLREERQALIESRGIDPEYLHRVRAQAANEPGTEEALAAGDAVFDEYLKGQETGEFRSRTGSPGNARR